MATDILHFLDCPLHGTIWTTGPLWSEASIRRVSPTVISAAKPPLDRQVKQEALLPHGGCSPDPERRGARLELGRSGESKITVLRRCLGVGATGDVTRL